MRSMLDVVTSFVLIATASVVIFRATFGTPGGEVPQLKVPSEPVSIEGAPLRGGKDAEVVMIVYADFQCPFCGRFARDTMPLLERQYVDTGKVAVAFKHLPLPNHPQALPAAVLAECAAQQGRFWEVHDVLFRLDQLDVDRLRAAAHTSELATSQLERCQMDPATGQRIQESAREASRLGIRATPAFLFGRRLDDGRIKVLRTLAGSKPTEEFIQQLDASMSGRPSRWWQWFKFATNSADFGRDTQTATF